MRLRVVMDWGSMPWSTFLAVMAYGAAWVAVFLVLALGFYLAPWCSMEQEDGAVVAAWGDVQTRYMCHSVRKSFLSALYGVHVSQGNMDLNKTLAELNIDDRPPLTDAEKRARVVDLLASRSGVWWEMAAVIEHPGVQAVTLTGSTPAGSCSLTVPSRSLTSWRAK